MTEDIRRLVLEEVGREGNTVRFRVAEQTDDRWVAPNGVVLRSHFYHTIHPNWSAVSEVMWLKSLPQDERLCACFVPEWERIREAVYAYNKAHGGLVEVWKVCRELEDGRQVSVYAGSGSPVLQHQARRDYTNGALVEECLAWNSRTRAVWSATGESVGRRITVWRALCEQAEPILHNFDGASILRGALSCREFRIVERVATYVDGKLVEEEAEAVFEHYRALQGDGGFADPRRRITELKAENVELREMATARLAHSRNLEAVIQKRNAEIAELRRLRDNAERGIQRLSKECAELRQRVKELEADRALQGDLWQRGCAKLRARIAALEAEVETLKAEREELLRKNRNQLMDNATLWSNIARVQAECGKMKDRALAAEAEVVRLAELLEQGADRARRQAEFIQGTCDNWRQRALTAEAEVEGRWAQGDKPVPGDTEAERLVHEHEKREQESKVAYMHEEHCLRLRRRADRVRDRIEKRGMGTIVRVVDRPRAPDGCTHCGDADLAGKTCTVVNRIMPGSMQAAVVVGLGGQLRFPFLHNLTVLVPAEGQEELT